MDPVGGGSCRVSASAPSECDQHARPYIAARALTFQTAAAAGTPADRILRMIQDIQRGSTPSSEDLSFVRSIVHRRLDIYNPLDVARQLLQAGSIDVSCKRLNVV